MTEQEKENVLHGLDSCGFCDGVPNICEVTECPYRGNKGWCVHELAHDAGMLISELMEEREAVKPKKLMAIKIGYMWRFYCGKCGDGIDRFDKYCRHCGRKVKWE